MKNSGVKEILNKPISIDELTSFIDRYNPDICPNFRGRRDFVSLLKRRVL